MTAARGRSHLLRPGARIGFDDADLTPAWAAPAPCVLFQHGLGMTMDIWADWLPLLCDGFRLVRIDLRGHGTSVQQEAGQALDFVLLIGDVLAVADAVGAQEFHFVGESLGGTLGLALAARRPDRVLSLTACNTAARGAGIAQVRGVWRSMIEDRGKAAWVDDMMPRRLHDGAVPPAVAAWVRQAHLDCDTATLLRLADLLTQVELGAELPKVAAPTLLLCPDGSPFIAPEAMRQLQAALPDAELHQFGHARHGLPVSHGRACAAVLREFITRKAARRG